MPSGDRTGPSGQGPLSGRRLGYCSGYDTPGYRKGPGAGMGRGSGFGRGRGFGRGMARGGGHGRGWDYCMPYHEGFHSYPLASPMSREDEISFLKSEADALKRSQKDIEKRLADLEKEKE
jgi:hypothetical protein